MRRTAGIFGRSPKGKSRKRSLVKGLGGGFEGVDHVGIIVRSIDESMVYYTEDLGLRSVFDETLPNLHTRLAYLDAGNTMLQLVEPGGPGALLTHLEHYGEGLHHICFAVPDVAATLSALTGEQEAKIFLGGMGRRACFLTGARNNLNVELIEQAGPGLQVAGPGIPGGASK